jgi:hypothetical protein
VPELARGVGGVQQPQVGVPRAGAPFPIGLLTAEDRAQVPLERERPLIQPTKFLEEVSIDDVLGLGARVDEAFRGTTLRGGREALSFVEAQQVAGACRVGGIYSMDGNRVTIRVKVHEGEKEIASFRLTGDKGKPDELASKIAARVEERVLHEISKN